MLKTSYNIAVRTIGSVLLLLFLLNPMPAIAQCAMCRAALGSSDNDLQAEAVNDGIVYLMIIPYLLVAVIGIVIYKSRKQARQGK